MEYRTLELSIFSVVVKIKIKKLCFDLLSVDR